MTVNSKLYPAQILAVIENLQAIFSGGYADRVIERSLKSDPRRGAADRAFIAETTYEAVRWYRLLWEIRGSEPTDISGWWDLIGILLIVRGKSLPPWSEFAGLDPDQIRRRHEGLLATRAIRESVPDWLDSLGAEELGEAWPPTLSALNRPAALVIRANSLKIKASDLLIKLKNEQVDAERMGDGDALIIKKRRNLFATQAFHEGLFEVQDYSSQLVAPLLDPQPGMRVIDACAGGGGKSLHLASLMKDKGKVLSLDTVPWKLEELRRRAKRAGTGIIETRVIDNKKIIKRLYDSADRLLLDVPCSGLGVLRRNPDAKWKISQAFIDKLKGIQHEILSDYSRMLKPGGRMVYATCSILPSENREQVQRFLNEGTGDFELITEHQILPQDKGFDGFYMALLSRKA